MSGFFTVILLASLGGVLFPFWGMRRRHFALTAFGAFIGVGAFAPAPTPQEIAAKEAEKAREAAEEAQIAAKERAEEERELAEARRSEHDRVVEKTRLALEVPPNYTRSEYRQTYSRVGAATFARLNRLEPGAAYVAAESRSCDRVTAAMVSDRSKPANAIWFVDCENGNRFMVEQAQAAAALQRFAAAKLAPNKLEESCTIDTVALCKASPAQKAAKDREIEFVSNCQILLERALVSPSSLDTRGGWRTDFGRGDVVTYRQGFDSQNAFGATLRAQYRCDVDATSGQIVRLEISGPTGTERVI